MFETIVRSAGNIVRGTFIPVIHAASNELDSKQNDNFIDRLKMALVPGYGIFFFFQIHSILIDKMKHFN